MARLNSVRTQPVPVTLRGMQAGGPGSGRHPGYNTTVATEHPFHQSLIDHGFKHNYSVKNSHYYLGDQSKRAEAKTDSGKPTRWTAGHSMSISTRHGKASWADPGSMAYSGDTKEGMEGYLHSIGYHGKEGIADLSKGRYAEERNRPAK
jgi:hypothetical protein